jgi:hypothetical protein
MKTHHLLSTLLLAGALIGLPGCSSKKNATIMPGANLGVVKKYYVVHYSSDNGKVNELIRDSLVSRGYQATTGDAHAAPTDVDALLTYQDKWMWDMTMYMLQLDMQIRNPKTDIPMATGMAMHTSLCRRSPKEMVKEVLDEIFTKAGQPPAKPSK